MKQLILSILFLISFIAISQDDTLSYSLPQITNLDSTDQAAFETKLKQIQSVKVVALAPYCTKDYFSKDTSINNLICYEETVIVNDSIDKSRFKSAVAISVEDFNSILSIFYAKEHDLDIHWSTSCYNPRHGIALYDEANKLIGFFEICFECRKIYTFSLPDIRFLIHEDYKQLKEIFLKYMTDNFEDEK